jgi:hypothetical protein
VAADLSTADLALDAEDAGTQGVEEAKDSRWRTEEAGWRRTNETRMACGGQGRRSAQR